MGNIGEPVKTVEFEPFPESAPAEPTAPSAPEVAPSEPSREAVPA